MTTPLAIETQDLTRAFNKTNAVYKLNLQIPMGIIYGFLGPNGCGKTTTLRMLTGLLMPTKGKASVLGHTLPKQAELLRAKVGYMTQKFSLYEDLTVMENLQFSAAIYGLDYKKSQQRISELLRSYHLTHHIKQLAGTMSGGQRQRLSLAAATIHRPQLLLLDEPTSAVDPQSRRDFWEQLFQLCEQGTTVLVSTHYMDEAERCHQLAIMDHGHKRADASPIALMKAINAHIIELEAPNLQPLKLRLISQPHIISVTQLGARLRILIPKIIPDPVMWVIQQLTSHTVSEPSLKLKIKQVEPSLEDVFVVCTKKQHEAFL